MGSFDVGLNAFLHYKPLGPGSVMWWYERKLTAKGVVVIGVCGPYWRKVVTVEACFEFSCMFKTCAVRLITSRCLWMVKDRWLHAGVGWCANLAFLIRDHLLRYQLELKGATRCKIIILCMPYTHLLWAFLFLLEIGQDIGAWVVSIRLSYYLLL